MNGGLARGERRRVKPSAGESSERTVASRPHRSRHGRGSARGSGWREIVIQRSNHRRKVVRRSRDRGCNGHRILRRVPAGGRHPGSSRSDVFHEAAWTMISAIRRTLRPVRAPSRKERTARLQLSRRRERREGGVRGSRQGCQRLGRIRRRGKKTPTLVSPAVRQGDEEIASNVDPPKRSRTS